MEVESNESAVLLKLLKTRSRTRTELLKVSSARRRARRAALDALLAEGKVIRIDRKYFANDPAGSVEQLIGAEAARLDVTCVPCQMLFPVRAKNLDRVLGTSARKPPLSDTLLWVTLSLAHPFEIEVILSKRVEVLPKQRGREAQNIVVDHLAFSAELADYRPDVQRIPSNDSVVQDRQTTERVDLIAELASPQRALLAKAEESRQVVRSLTFVKFAAH